MESENKKSIASLLAVLFPGAGHLYQERYVVGTALIIMASWTLIILIISLALFENDIGIGRWLFPVSLYILIGIWAVSPASVLLHGVRIKKVKPVDRRKLYLTGYGAYLREEFDNASEQFRRLLRYNPTDTAAIVMSACIHQRKGELSKALSLLRKAQKRTSDTGWHNYIENLGQMFEAQSDSSIGGEAQEA